jgi:methylase of polypeptide subunit release factors
LADETPAISYCVSETNSEIARLARHDMRTTYEDTSALDRATLPPSRSKQLLRTAIHLLSYHFILTRRRTTVARVAGFRLSVRPTVFHPRYFLSSKFFANFLSDIDLAGKRVADVGTGSGILALAAARAGAASVVALDINPNAAKAAAENADANGPSKPIMVVGSNPALSACTAVVPENSIRRDSRSEAESAHHPMRCLRSSTCLQRS